MAENNIVLNYRNKLGHNNKPITYKRMVDGINCFMPAHKQLTPTGFYEWATRRNFPAYLWMYLSLVATDWIKDLADEMVASEIAEQAGEK